MICFNTYTQAKNRCFPIKKSIIKWKKIKKEEDNIYSVVIPVQASVVCWYYAKYKQLFSHVADETSEHMITFRLHLKNLGDENVNGNFHGHSWEKVELWLILRCLWVKILLFSHYPLR